jgi:hypothetical protein
VQAGQGLGRGGKAEAESRGRAVAPNRKAAPAALSGDGARQAVDDCITALNTRDATGLIRIGGVKDESWSRSEAEKILADKGGRGWKISRLEIGHDMGPDGGSARSQSRTGRAGP